MDAVVGLLVLALYVAWVVWAGRIAKRRGRSRTAWTVLGVFFGLFAVAAVALLPARTPQPEVRSKHLTEEEFYARLERAREERRS
jgi:hypothetical protein